MKKLVIGVTVVALLVLGGAVGAWFYGEKQADAALKVALLGPGATGTVTHGALHYSLMDDRIDADAVVVKSADARFNSMTVAHFAVSGLDPVGIRHLFSGGARLEDVAASGLAIEASTGEKFQIDQVVIAGVDPVAAQAVVAGAASAASGEKVVFHPFASVTASGIKLTEPTGTASFHSIELSGLTLTPPFPSLVQSAGTLSPDVIEAFLGALSADKARVEDAELDMHDSDQPHVTVHRLEAAGVAPGRFAAVHVEALRVVQKDGTDMQLGKLDLANIAYPTDAGLTPEMFFAGLVLGMGSVQDVDFKLMQDEQPHLTLHRAEISGVAPGQIAAAHAEALSGAGKDGTKISLGGFDLTTFAYPPGPIDKPEAFFAALSLDKGSVDDLDIELPQEAEQPHMSLHRLEIDGLAPGQVGAGRLETLGVSTQDGVRFHLGNAQVANIAYRLRDAGAADALPSLRGIFMEKFGIADVSGTAPDGAVISLASYDMKMTGSVDIATGFDMALKELAVDLAGVKDLPAGFSPDDLGTSRLVLNVDAHSTYDPKAKVVDMPRYAFVMPKLGSLTMAARLGNFEVDPNASDPEAALQRLMAATVQRFEVRYDDDSLVPHLMAIFAKENGQTVDEVRKGLVAMLQQQGAALGRDPALLKMLDTVIAFVQQPKSLTVAIEPTPPLAMADFQQLAAMAPAEISKRLGLSMH